MKTVSRTAEEEVSGLLSETSLILEKSGREKNDVFNLIVDHLWQKSKGIANTDWERPANYACLCFFHGARCFESNFFQVANEV